MTSFHNIIEYYSISYNTVVEGLRVPPTTRVHYADFRRDGRKSARAKRVMEPGANLK